MSESGESQPQDDSDVDIYKDFADFNFGDELAKLEQSKETIKKEALDLSEQVKVLTKENEELRKSNEILKKNMSSLLKTAQAEVQRKDSMIEELRTKIDSFTFKRKNNRTKDAFTSTQDLEITAKMKNANSKKRSKSKECRSSCENERKPYQEEHKSKESEDERENLNCDNNRKFGYYRDCTRRKSRPSDRHYESYSRKESRSRETSRKGEPDNKGSSSDNRKGHLKYNSLDKRKRSRSSDRRFTYRRRNSQTRRSERLEEWRRERKDVSGKAIRRRRHSGKDKSRSRERSRCSKESSLDPPKSRSSSDKDSGIRNKESRSGLRETNEVKVDSDESKKGRGRSEKEKSEKNQVKTGGGKTKKISKEENSGKNEKHGESDKFSTKSPLDALYNDMMTSKSAGRFSKQGSGVTKPEPDVEEGKLAKTAQQEGSIGEEGEEDWTLSFKNERKDTIKPMTLYSRRMMRKLSGAKETETLVAEEKPVTRAASKEIKKNETEKEPGELTDDESVIESSKEFQELTKAASIDNATAEKLKETEPFKEPIAKEQSIAKSKSETESRVEEADSSNEAQREIRDVIEYSPFKNNYKLIEISPVKPPDKEQIMELHSKRAATGQLQKEVESSIFNLLSSLTGIPLATKIEAEETKVEKPKEVQDDSGKKPENKTEQPQREPSNEKIESKPRSRRNSKSRKSDVKKTEKKTKATDEESKSKESEEVVPPGDATQFLDFFLLTTSPSKLVVSGQPETPGKIEKVTNSSDPKSDATNFSGEKVEVKNSRTNSKKENAKAEEKKKTAKKNESQKNLKEKPKDAKKEKENSKKEIENRPNSKIQKRKRNSDSEPEAKKPKLDESPRKRTRSQQNSGSKTEPKPKSECQSEAETNVDVKEDITKFEFFKPLAKKDAPDTPVECKMAAMSVANIVCLETPNKGATNLKNLMINEQMILNVLDSKNPALCSPLMTPRRLLKNDLMLTDSEDDSGNKGNVGGEEEEGEGEDDDDDDDDDEEEEEEEEEEEGNGMSESENSECESDSEASDFVDLL